MVGSRGEADILYGEVREGFTYGKGTVNCSSRSQCQGIPLRLPQTHDSLEYSFPFASPSKHPGSGIRLAGIGRTVALWDGKVVVVTPRCGGHTQTRCSVPRSFEPQFMAFQDLTQWSLPSELFPPGASSSQARPLEGLIQCWALLWDFRIVGKFVLVCMVGESG